MASPSKFGALHETPIKSNTEMKLITSPQKQPFDIYSELCRSPSLHQEKALFSYDENNQVPSWNESSPIELISSPVVDANKENEPVNQPQKQSFQTVKKTQKKGCHCQKSHCLKKYCDCFKIGQTCTDDCACIGCKNNCITDSHLKSRKLFQLTKSGKGKGIKCNCLKSHCLKNYCECRSAGRFCSPACHCVECDNKDDDVMGLHGKKRKHLENISEWNPSNILFH